MREVEKNLRDAEDEIFEMFVELRILRQNIRDNKFIIESIEKKIQMKQVLVSKIKQLLEQRKK